jgi:hypothetical protein
MDHFLNEATEIQRTMKTLRDMGFPLGHSWYLAIHIMTYMKKLKKHHNKGPTFR